MKKRFGAMILCVALVLATMPASVFAVTETSGTCGAGVTWSFSDGTLTIAGTGAVTSAPWSAYKDEIRHVVIDMPAGTFTSTNGNYMNISFSGYSNVSQVDFVQYPLQSITAADGKTYEGLTLSENMFRKCIGLTSIVIPTQVTSLPQYIFMNCGNLENVTLPENLQSIGYYAFSYCSTLRSIHIPSSTKEFGDGAFYACSSLQQIELPYGLEAISESMFVACNSLQSVNIPASVKKIGEQAFSSCYSLRSISIPGKVSSIGANAFSGCSNLASVALYEGLEYIYANAFKNCYQLTVVIIPDSVQEIYAGAFDTGRTDLGVSFGGGSLPKIVSNSFTPGATLHIPCRADGDYGTYGNYQLDLVHDAVVENKCSVCGAAISAEGSGSTGEGEAPSGTLTYTLSTAKGQYLYYDIATGYITGYSANQALTNLVIPDTIEGYKVKGIKDRAFRNCSSLVSLETNAAYIGVRAFENCYNLKTVHLTGTKKIKSYAFANCCNSLESVTLPNTLTYMGYYAFQNCSMLKSISFPDGMQSIGTCALRATNLKTLTVPISCKLYGSTFGWNYVNLDTLTFTCGSSDGIIRRTNVYQLIRNGDVQNVVLSEGIKEIANSAFDCGGIYHISLPSTLERIGNRVFRNCYQLESINLSNVEAIGELSFWNCRNLKAADLSNLQELGTGAFEYCNSLTEVNIGKSLLRIPARAFNNCRALTTVTFAEDAVLCDIGEYAFQRCTSLDGIILPDSATNVGRMAFDGCISLQNITLPESLQTLDDAAFNRCESLETVTLPNSVRNMAYGVFGNCTNLTQLNLNEGLESVGDAVISNTKIDSLTVPESVRSIAYRAFTQCETLANLTLPISADYFEGREWLEAFNPNLINIIFTPGTGEGVDFDMNTAKETPWYLNKENPGFRIQFTDGIKSIGEYAFAYNNLTAVDQLPASVERIGDYAFFRNKQLQSVKLREGLKKIGYQAFAECEPLTETVLPASLTTIKSNSFMGDDDMVATVCKNSAALAYCQKYGIPYKLSGSDTIQLPDVPEAKEVGSLQVGKEIYAKSETELLVPISLTSNPGIASLVLNLDYDHTALELTDVTPGDALSGGQWNLRNGNDALSTEALYWDNNSGDQNLNGTGILAILHFTMKENAKYGQEYSIKATTEGDNGGAFDSDGSAVQFVCNDGWLEVDDFVYGNVTADLENVIDMMDVAQLKWFISRNWVLEELQQKAGDVNRDGKINALDAMILERHVAKWSGYDKLPYVKSKNAV